MKEKVERWETLLDILRTRKELIFVLFLLVGELAYWFIMICTNSQDINSYFHSDNVDTFMDYFNMLKILETPRHVIYETKVIYPALCFCLWNVAFAMVPHAYQSMSAFELRNYLPAMLVFVFCLLLTIVGLWELLKKNFRCNGVKNVFFALSILFSGPILFAVERGNIILLALLFLLVFELLYNSENKYLRYLSYFALALSASIKIYPALFGVLIFSHKRWKEAFGAIVIGLLTFILPFVYLCGWGGNIII